MGLRLKAQQSPAVLGAKILRAEGLLPLAGVGSVVTAHAGDAPTSGGAQRSARPTARRAGGQREPSTVRSPIATGAAHRLPGTAGRRRITP